ncbi:MAG: glycosyltransferase [Candidatus Hydrogenedentota bacterium]
MMTSLEQNHLAPAKIDVSFVVIGYNESETLKECLDSVNDADIEGLTSELIYVDGGSTDSSIEIAQETGVDVLLGGEKRRRAAENRNLGMGTARGRFIQFLDGDMTLSPDWPRAAVEFLKSHDDFAAVCGNLNEASPGILFEALQIDWVPREDTIRHCGGAAMYVRETLQKAGGFPTNVAYGEEPLLCWRLRNDHKKKIYQLNRVMAKHNLGFRGIRDYWRRNVRCGQTYAEIATRCWRTADPLWRKECIRNAAWAFTMLAAIFLLIIGNMWIRGGVIVVAVLVIIRKFVQTKLKGYRFSVSLVYAFHTYFSKLSIAWGEVRWAIGQCLGSQGKEEHVP